MGSKSQLVPGQYLQKQFQNSLNKLKVVPTGMLMNEAVQQQ